METLHQELPPSGADGRASPCAGHRHRAPPLPRAAASGSPGGHPRVKPERAPPTPAAPGQPRAPLGPARRAGARSSARPAGWGMPRVGCPGVGGGCGDRVPPRWAQRGGRTHLPVAEQRLRERLQLGLLVGLNPVPARSSPRRGGEDPPSGTAPLAGGETEAGSRTAAAARSPGLPVLPCPVPARLLPPPRRRQRDEAEENPLQPSKRTELPPGRGEAERGAARRGTRHPGSLPAPRAEPATAAPRSSPRGGCGTDKGGS